MQKLQIMIKKINYYLKRFIEEIRFPRTKYFIFFKSLTGTKIKTKKIIAIYDLSSNPITFDFLEFLICAEMYRIYKKKDRIDIFIVTGFYKGLRKESDDYEKIINFDKRIWRIYNILIPCISFFKSIERFSVNTERKFINKLIKTNKPEDIYPEKYNPNLPTRHNEGVWLEYYKKINKIPYLESLKSSQEYIDIWLKNNIDNNKKIIVITLRMYNFRVKRNSNVEAWIKFATELDKNKYEVIFIPDTDSVMELNKHLFKDFHLFTEACWNLNLRLSIMEKAYLNFVISGIAHLCTFTKRPYIFLKCLTEDYFSKEFE